MLTMYFRTLEEFKKASGYDIDGIWYPRVTAIVAMKAKPGLYKFYAEQKNFEAGEAIKTKSAEEGMLIHNLIEAILAGKSPVIPATVQPVMTAFFRFLENNQVKAHQIETRLISKYHRYSGTLDVLAEINGVMGVLDIKTSYSIFRDYGIQTAAYAQALTEDRSLPFSAFDRALTFLTRWILRLDQYQRCQNCSAVLRTKGGMLKVRQDSSSCQHLWGETVGEVELKELAPYQKDFQAFLACKTLWEWENDFWLGRLR